MKGLIQDVMNNPRDYTPVLTALGSIVLVWIALFVSSCFSLLARTQRPRFWMAVVPLVFSLLLVFAKMPVSVQLDDFRLSFDCRWFFLVPLLLSLSGLYRWWKADKAEKAAREAA